MVLIAAMNADRVALAQFALAGLLAVAACPRRCWAGCVSGDGAVLLGIGGVTLGLALLMALFSLLMVDV